MNANDLGAQHANGTYSSLTKRELFAAMAMQGLSAIKESEDSPRAIAELSVVQADELLRQLAKDQP